MAKEKKVLIIYNFKKHMKQTRPREGYRHNRDLITATTTITKLPQGWRCGDGLKFPLDIDHCGLTYIFNTYADYHQFIKNLFKNAKI